MYLQTGKKTHSWLPDFSFLIWNKPRSSTTCLLEEVLVQTPLRGHLCRVVVWADPELEVPHVVGRQLHPHLDGLTTDVPPDKNALPIHTTSFIVTRLKKNYSVLSREKGSIELRSIHFSEEEGAYSFCAHADPTLLFPSQASTKFQGPESQFGTRILGFYVLTMWIS